MELGTWGEDFKADSRDFDDFADLLLQKGVQEMVPPIRPHPKFISFRFFRPKSALGFFYIIEVDVPDTQPTRSARL